MDLAGWKATATQNQVTVISNHGKEVKFLAGDTPHDNHRHVDANGILLPVHTPEGIVAFEAIKAKAKVAGTYEGHSLVPGEGGRFRMLVDELQIVDGMSEAKAKAIASNISRAKYG